MPRTGKTFRAILESLKLASEGKHVIYECETHAMARWTFDKAADIVYLYMGSCEIPMPLTLKIANGTIRFTKRLSERDLIGLKLDRKDYKMTIDV